MRFGKWVSLNFNETSQQTLRQARNLWEVFGEQRDEVQPIPLDARQENSHPPEPMLAWPKMKVLARFTHG